MTPDTPVWIAAARAGIAFHEIAPSGRRTLCGRYIGPPGNVQHGYVQHLAWVVDAYGSQPCKACGGASVPPRVVPSRDRT